MTLTDWWQCPRCPAVALGGRCDRCGCQRPHAVRVTLSPAEAALLAAGNVGPAATAAVFGAAGAVPRDADAARGGRFAADPRLLGEVRP